MNKRTLKDNLFNGLTLLGVFVTVSFIVIIFGFVFIRGYGLLNIEILSSQNQTQSYVGSIDTHSFEPTYTKPNETQDNHFFIKSVGITIFQDEDLAGNPVIRVSHVDEQSPLQTIKVLNGNIIALEENMIISRISFDNAASAQRNQGARHMANTLEENVEDMREISFSIPGGGIRPSIISTLYLIGLTLTMILPIGILSALYLSEFAKDTRTTRLIRRFIETLAGVPSIVFGLIGLSVFVPLTTSLTPATSSNLIAAAMTMSALLLPVVIRTTEEGFRRVPQPHKNASYALGANKTQTSAFIVLSSSLPHVFTSIFLAIGRIVGESAALIFVLGTAIRDDVNMFSRTPSLAVHIWSLMSSEPPNVALASAIAVIILIIVLILNISIKLIIHRYKRSR